MKDIGKTVLERIRNEQVTPYSKWHFLFKRSVIRGFFILSILLGSLATGIAIFQLKNAEWDMYGHFNHSLIEFILIILPYFWLGFMVLFSVFSYYYFKRTEGGYRYRALIVVCGSLFLSTILGGLLSGTVIPERVEVLFQDNIQFYRQIEMHRQKVWMNPETGFLAGTVRDVPSEEMMVFEDFNGKIWKINIKDTVFRGRLKPERKLRIKIIGEMIDSDHFTAFEVRPFRGKCRMRGSCGPGGRGPQMKTHRKFGNQHPAPHGMDMPLHRPD